VRVGTTTTGWPFHACTTTGPVTEAGICTWLGLELGMG
jgi:hypothetical protein